MESSQALAAAIATTAMVPAIVGIAVDTARRFGHVDLWSIVKGPLVTAVVCTSLLRTAPTMAVTPPPIERLEAGVRPRPLAETAPKPDSPHHVVAVGDSLWAIACRTLRLRSGSEPSNLAIDTYWRSIYAANRAVVGDDPNLIFPGQRLVLP